MAIGVNPRRHSTSSQGSRPESPLLETNLETMFLKNRKWYNRGILRTTKGKVITSIAVLAVVGGLIFLAVAPFATHGVAAMGKGKRKKVKKPPTAASKNPTSSKTA